MIFVMLKTQLSSNKGTAALVALQVKREFRTSKILIWWRTSAPNSAGCYRTVFDGPSAGPSAHVHPFHVLQRVLCKRLLCGGFMWAHHTLGRDKNAWHIGGTYDSCILQLQQQVLCGSNFFCLRRGCNVRRAYKTWSFSTWAQRLQNQWCSLQKIRLQSISKSILANMCV